MKRLLLTALFAAVWVSMLTPSLQAQGSGNIDWEELWVRQQPLSPNVQDHWKWMAGLRTYTGLAYDHKRDVLYIVNPGLQTIGTQTYGNTKIHVWDANTGNPKLTVGRTNLGTGGEVPVPQDTIPGYPFTGWPGGTYSSFSQGQFPLYKIDVDEDGRIFACNLVSPVWGLCYPGPPPNCDPDKLIQGPFRIYRWDTPSSTPRRVYATLNAAHTGTPGTPTNTEMKWTRWGDAFDVVGGQKTVIVDGQPVLVDSVRIFTSGGYWTGSTTPAHENDEINVFLAEDRPEQSRISDGLGRRLPYRLAIKLLNGIPPNTLRLRHAHGIAVTGDNIFSQIWHDTNGSNELAVLNNQAQTTAAFPQTHSMTRNHVLSSDPGTGTGPTGPMAFFSGGGYQWLMVCDGQPADPNDVTADNPNTRARVMNVTTLGQEYREPGMGDTPFFGRKNQHSNSGVNNYIADIDYKLDPDLDSAGYYHLVLFVLQSNNGIAAFRSRVMFRIPVELQTFSAQVNGSGVDLSWKVANETNNLGWTIQRSFDGGKAWEDVTFIQGRGTTNEGRYYDYTDPITETHRMLGSAKYRLVQMDSDGRKSFSNAVEVYMDAEAAPGGFQLHQNFPNPFNPSTTIGFNLRETGFVTLKVFNQMGELITTLVNESRDPGLHNVTFDASTLPSGTYIYQINVDGRMQQKKMVLMK
jgi:hypothetical protein